jgi:hypothetical protein
VLGTIEQPSQLVVGRYRDGELVIVGRTSPLLNQILGQAHLHQP